MKRIFVIYQEQGKTKKAILNENSFNSLKQRGEVFSLEEFPNEYLMEVAYASKIGKNTNQTNKKMIFG